MYDTPDRTLSMAGLFFGIICFYTFPFLTLFFSGGTLDRNYRSWFECIYHGVNFLITLWLFRNYLKESFFHVQCDLRSFFLTVFICIGIMLVYAVGLIHLLLPTDSELLFLAVNGTLPLVEMEIFNVSSNLVALNPIGGLISIVIFSPITISCVYYASTFAPFCANRPWLAYLMMAVILTVPRALSSLTFWPWDQNFTLYLAQLPLHMIACWSYQKTNTVWGPIATHTIANAISGILLLVLLAI